MLKNATKKEINFKNQEMNIEANPNKSLYNQCLGDRNKKWKGNLCI